MKKAVRTESFSVDVWLSCLWLFVCFASCSTARHDTRPAKDIPMSAVPSSFVCHAEILELLATDSAGCGRARIKIVSVDESGQGLTYQPAAGDTLHWRDCSIRTHPSVKKNDVVTILLEERLKLNSDIPDFLVRQLRKEEKH